MCIESCVSTGVSSLVVESWDLPGENLEFIISQIHFAVLSVQP